MFILCKFYDSVLTGRDFTAFPICGFVNGGTWWGYFQFIRMWQLDSKN